MKCPKCDYTSFDHNERCPQCSRDLSKERQRLNLPDFTPTPLFLLRALAPETSAPGFEFQMDHDTPIEIELQDKDMDGEDSQLMEAMELDLQEGREIASRLELETQNGAETVPPAPLSVTVETDVKPEEVTGRHRAFEDERDLLELSLEDLAMEDLEPETASEAIQKELDEAFADHEPANRKPVLRDEDPSSITQEELFLADSNYKPHQGLNKEETEIGTPLFSSVIASDRTGLEVLEELETRETEEVSAPIYAHPEDSRGSKVSSAEKSKTPSENRADWSQLEQLVEETASEQPSGESSFSLFNLDHIKEEYTGDVDVVVENPFEYSPSPLPPPGE